MSETPSTSKVRIIPIQMEEDPPSKEATPRVPHPTPGEDAVKATPGADGVKTSRVEDTNATPDEDVSNATHCEDHADFTAEHNEDNALDDVPPPRALPMYNAKEKILLVIDSAEDEDFTPFKLANAQHKPLDMLKRAVEMFIRSKNTINKKHEYALAVLNENSVIWVTDFTSNVNDVLKALHGINTCKTEDVFELNALFKTILENAPVPQVREVEARMMPPSYVVRVILFYGRSYTMPKLVESEEVSALLEAPYFMMDILMTHEPVDDDNNCSKIFKVLQNLDRKGFSYFFPVARDTKSLFDSMAKLLGHPLQRPTQQCADYSLNIPNSG